MSSRLYKLLTGVLLLVLLALFVIQHGQPGSDSDLQAGRESPVPSSTHAGIRSQDAAGMGQPNGIRREIWNNPGIRPPENFQEGTKYGLLELRLDSGRVSTFADRQALVRFDDVPGDALLNNLASAGFYLQEPLFASTYLVRWTTQNPARDYSERMDYLAGLGETAELEPDYLVHAMGMAPTDPNAWCYNSSAPYINAENLRADGMVIAVLDSGINTQHEDLQNILYLNPSETVDGIDNDANGYEDDLYGYDFVSLDTMPEDEDGHGTAVAGVIAATGNNGKGINGLAQGARILNIRILDQGGLGFVSDAIKGITYASSLGASILNCSWGGEDYSSAMRSALYLFIDAGGMVIAAAGNDATDLRTFNRQVYPACYDFDALLSIGSYDRNLQLSDFSNYSDRLVDWLLPGDSLVLPSLDNDGYDPVSGTSFAAPIMSSLLSLAKTSDPGLNWSEILEKLKRSTIPHPAFYGQVTNYGIIDFSRYHENNPIALPSLQLDVSPDEYFVGDQVTLRALGLGDHLGTLEWHRNSIRTYGSLFSLNEREVSVTAEYDILDTGFYFQFNSYYGKSSAGPVYLNPKIRDLYLTEAFQAEYRLNIGDSANIAASVGGSDPITVNWYDEFGNLLQNKASFIISRFNVQDQRRIYFVADNGVSRIKSPLISIDFAEFNLKRFESSIGLIKNLVYGNGVYIASTDASHFVSMDGVHWEDYTSSRNDFDCYPVYFRGRFYTLTNGQLISSENGILWSALDVEDFPVNAWGVRLTGEFLQVLGDDIIQTVDGQSWSPGSGFIHAGKYYYQYSDDEKMMYSQDLTTWSSVSGIWKYFSSVAYSGGVYVAYGDATYLSYDGINWESTLPVNGAITYAFETGDSQYFGNDNAILVHRPDGEIHSWGMSGMNIWSFANGHLFAGYQSHEPPMQYYYIELSEPLPESEFLDWNNIVETDLILGDSLQFSFAIDDANIQRLSLYLDNQLYESRNSEPYYSDWYIDEIGSFKAVIKIEGRDGSTRYSRAKSINVSLPGDRLDLGVNSLSSNFGLIGNGDDLGIVLQTGSASTPRISWIADIFDASGPLDFVGAVASANGKFIRSMDGQSLYLLGLLPASWLELYRIYRDGSYDHINTFHGGSANSYHLWNNSLVLWPTAIQSGTWTVSRILSGAPDPFLEVPEDAFVFQDNAGNWKYVIARENLEVNQLGNHCIYLEGESLVTDLTTGKTWTIPHSHRSGFEAYGVLGVYGDWILIEGCGLNRAPRELLHRSGDTRTFQLSNSFQILDYQDARGWYIAGVNREHAVIRLWPRNEILLDTENAAPFLSSAESGLVLNVPVEVRQLSIGPEQPLTVTFDVFISRDSSADLDTATPIGSYSSELPLKAGTDDPVLVQVPLDEMLPAGTYRIGVIANAGEKDFPDRTFNNTAWHEWTRERTLPVELESLFDDVAYAGLDRWHSSFTFGWFESSDYPWIYHLDHGWIYAHVSPEHGGLYYFEAQMGWVFVHPESYPFIYRMADRQWLYYLKETRSPRWFFEYLSGSWISVYP